LFDELAEDENQTLSDEQLLDKDCKSVFDSIIGHIGWRYESLHAVATDFSFLFVQFLLSQPVEIVQKHAADLAFQYETDLNAVELISEVESFKCRAAELLKEPDKCRPTPMDLLQFIHSYSLT